MKLKTLKDLRRPSSNYYYPNNSFVTKQQLKAEAVKWVKDFDCEYKRSITAIDFMKKFFNITEEDLKK